MKLIIGNKIRFDEVFGLCILNYNINDLPETCISRGEIREGIYQTKIFNSIPGFKMTLDEFKTYRYIQVIK